MVVKCELKIPSYGNCSASQGWLSDAEQLSQVMEFSICTKQPLQILFSVFSSFDNCS